MDAATTHLAVRRSHSHQPLCIDPLGNVLNGTWSRSSKAKDVGVARRAGAAKRIPPLESLKAGYHPPYKSGSWMASIGARTRRCTAPRRGADRASKARMSKRGDVASSHRRAIGEHRREVRRHDFGETVVPGAWFWLLSL